MSIENKPEETKKSLTREEILSADTPSKVYKLPSGKVVSVKYLAFFLARKIYKRSESKTEGNIEHIFTEKVIHWMLRENDQKDLSSFSEEDQKRLIEIAIQEWGYEEEYDTLSKIENPEIRFYQAVSQQEKKIALQLLETLERTGNRLEKMLFQLKWPPPGLLPATLIDQLSFSFENGQLTTQDVDKILVQFYNKDRLQEMLNTWSERGHFPHRMQILKEAIAAHIEGKFELSIPTLLPQIEGIIAEIFEHAGQMHFEDIKGYLESIFKRNSRFDRINKKFYLSTLLENFEWQDPIPFFSRNAILHGADTNYPSASNSLRLILIFDQLQDSFQVPLKLKTG